MLQIITNLFSLTRPDFSNIIKLEYFDFGRDFLKKILCITTILILLFSTVFCLPTYAEASPTITVSQLTAIPGDTVVVNVDIKDNPGIQAMTFTLSYDNTVVSFEKYTKGGLKDYTIVNHENTGYVSFVNCESTNKKYNGTIFSVTFKVKDDAAAGEYAFKICNISPLDRGEDLAGCFANKEHTKITPIIENGKLIVGETCKNSGHKFSDWSEVTAPGCVEKGAESRSCKREGCGHTETRETDPIGHNFEDKWTVDKAATESESGTMSRHCTRCTATKDEMFFDLDLPADKDFENKEEAPVTPDKWEVLEEIIEEEKEAEKQENKKDKDSDSPIGKFPKTVYIIFGAAAILTIVIIIVLIIILTKRGNKK